MKNAILFLMGTLGILLGNAPHSHAQIIPNVQPQNIDPTTWTYKVNQVDKDEYEVVFHVALEKGWHIFSQNPGDDMLIPPTFSFDKNNDMTLIESVQEKGKLIETEFEGFDTKLRYFEGDVTFIQRIVYRKKNGVITGEHRYQICNDTLCLPPTSKIFEFVIKN